MNWKYRLLCWFGRHDWVRSYGLIRDDLSTYTAGERCCLRCGKLEQ